MGIGLSIVVLKLHHRHCPRRNGRRKAILRHQGDQHATGPRVGDDAGRLKIVECRKIGGAVRDGTVKVLKWT